MAWYTNTRIHYHRHGGLRNDDLQHCPGFQPLVGANRRAQRHNGGAANIFQTFAEYRIGTAVRQNDEPLLYQLFRRFQRLDRVGQQPASIRVNFQLQPACAERFTRQLGGENGLFGRFRAGSIWQ